MTGKRPRPPLDEDALREMALRYVGRFATSRAKLLDYLRRKIGEGGWGGAQPADPQALVDRLAALGYVDDSGYAVMKSAALARRGYGARRVDESLRAAGIAQADRTEADARTEAEGWDAAERFARRKRIGPFAAERPDPKLREKWMATFLRAGHRHALARRWVDAPPGEPPERDEG
ncbi:regulatory protein RecX [Sphingobium cloacae]|uniref:regulatory protein RecX n=1 Tax=Sphingobium cloacae TaxID=120107 RepID=UPI0008378632|nr:RecX family transcriptional regulator [Sphingobium cloacae]